MARLLLCRYCFLLVSCLFGMSVQGQVLNDLKKSVPVWFEYNEIQHNAVLKWLNDPGAANYNVGEVRYQANPQYTSLGVVTGGVDSFLVPAFEKGKKYHYRISKSTGAGFIDFGIEQPLVHNRGRCLVLMDDRFSADLAPEIRQWMADIRGDGWSVDTQSVSRNLSPPEVKAKIQSWYKTNYTLSQSVILFGNIPVPYSGNTAIDGHPDHAGAWASDTYYADINGSWTDTNVDITTASRPENRNSPGDGKFDQFVIPSDVELEVGRIDFSNLPAFAISEKDLLKNYLNKNHRWRRGLNPYPGKSLIENNFASFEEGFGQNGWRNFLPMFGKDNVASGDYETQLVTDKHVFSYACGGGSYTSCGGIGTTQNLWAAKHIQTVFTMTFGSYFGDFDSQNNFLRSALASGDILANMWAGRPNWMLTSMASGAHIGHCTKLTQNANAGFFFGGNGARFTHVALMGDPTLRLHPLVSVSGLTGEESEGVVRLKWTAQDSSHTDFAVYIEKSGEFELLDIVSDVDYYNIPCLEAGNMYTFMVKPVQLTNSASGSYFNSGTGEIIGVFVNDSSLPSAAFNHETYYERVVFTNTSSHASVYEWDFGDGNRSPDSSPTHVFNQAGKYNVCLSAKNDVCPENITCSQIEVLSSLPSGITEIYREPSCYGMEDGAIMIFSIDGSPDDIEYRWNTGVTTKDLTDIAAGEYMLRLTSKITGHSITKFFTLDQPDSLSVTATTTPSTGQDGTIIIDIQGGSPLYSILWTGGLDLTALPAGEYRITVTDANGCSAQVTAVVEMSSGIHEVLEEVKLFPNPTNSNINLAFSHRFTRYKVFDLRGLLIIKNQTEGHGSVTINCENLLPGQYYIMLEGDGMKPVVISFSKLETP
jgi:PKD repeat protein